MQMVHRSIVEPPRENLTWDELWKGSDQGLIICWEVGRKLAQKHPDVSEKAKKGELPILPWKGGVEKKLKAKIKYGTLYYLAQWQGLRGEDLSISISEETEITCTRSESLNCLNPACFAFLMFAMCLQMGF